MAITRELLESLEAAARESASVAADRERRRDLFRATLQCLTWSAVGLACIGWGFHSTDAELGRVVFVGGVGAANAGIIFTILGAYRRGERRGHW
jgi:hypothetical protein